MPPTLTFVITPTSQPLEWERMWSALAADPINQHDRACECSITGAVWQYLCTTQADDGQWFHYFRHRHHPTTDCRETRLIPSLLSPPPSTPSSPTPSSSLLPPPHPSSLLPPPSSFVPPSASVRFTADLAPEMHQALNDLARATHQPMTAVLRLAIAQLITNPISPDSAPPPEEATRLTVDLEPELHRELSMLAARQGRRKVELVRSAIQRLLADWSTNQV